MNSSDVLSGLNSDQVQAVTHPLLAPAMVLAGAGSGKTKVLTTRVAWLIQEHHVIPSSILLVTFTNKASQEMMRRVERLTGTSLPFSGTFHSLCARILRSYGSHVGLSPSFTIYDEDDQLSLLKSIMVELGIREREAKPRAILSMISQAKNELVSPTEYSQMARGKYQEMVARLYPLYQSRLTKNDAADFDDLLVKVVELLQENQEIQIFYQDLFDHILIDEYQDTNTAQYALTKLLIGKQRNLFVVGDFSQAIYGWRGADYRNMLKLSSDFTDIATYRLEQNYRSTQSILDAASGVISNNTSHPVLSLWTAKEHDEKVAIYEASSDSDEVEYILRHIRSYHAKYPYSEMAVLYRTNAQSRAFEEGLLQAGIPYRLVGGVRFYARKEIKDLLSYLRLLTFSEDEVAISRLKKMGKRKLEQFLQWVLGREKKEDMTKTPLELLDAVLAITSYRKQFDEHDEEDVSRLENIEELRSVAGQFKSLSEFLEAVALVEQETLLGKKREQSDSITLMSVHAAKGLEFEIVFVVGVEEGLFPHSRSLFDRLQMEEERRLYYVALTRAKNHLHVSYARRRLLYGTVKGAIVSRFISEIPSTALIREGVRENNDSWEVKTPKRRLIPLDDPSIDDFLNGNLDVDVFLNS